MAKATIKTLKAARELFKEDRNVASGALFAGSIPPEYITVNDVLASECFCVMGAVLKVEVEEGNTAAITAISTRNINVNSVYDYLRSNDSVKALASAIFPDTVFAADEDIAEVVYNYNDGVIKLSQHRAQVAKEFFNKAITMLESK